MSGSGWSLDLEASDTRRDGLPLHGRRDGARCREPNRHAACGGMRPGPLTGDEGDVEAGVAEFEHRLAVPDAQRVIDACGERLDAGDEGGRRDRLGLEPQLLELGT